MESNQFFATAKPSKLFFIVAIPGMVSMLAASVYSVIEGIFIGQFLGQTAFAAINIAIPFVMINFSLADLVGVGSSVPISIALGQRDHDRANNIFSCAILLILLAAAFMGVLIYSLAPVMVSWMGADGMLAELSIRYARIYAITGPVTTLVFAMDNYLRICGFVRGSMLLNIFMSALTIGLLALFILGFGMNVDGSALATSLAMSFCAMLALIPFLRKKTILKLVRPKFSGALVRQIISCGAPTFLNNIAGRVASIVMNIALMRMGGQQAMAVYAVLMYASDIIQPMLYGLSDSLQPAIGYNWGAGSLNRVRDIGKCSFTACAVVSLLGTCVMFFFSRPISSLFVSATDPELLSVSARAMKLFCTAYLFRWLGFAIQGFFTAIEKPLPASVLSVSSAMVFPVLLVFLLMPLGLDGLWLNLAGTSILVSILAVCLLIPVQKRMQRDMRTASKP